MVKQHLLNVPLKVAILSRALTQRRFARRVGIDETRLSHIVRGHGVAVTADEKRRIARALRQPIATLFPAADADEARP